MIGVPKNVAVAGQSIGLPIGAHLGTGNETFNRTPPFTFRSYLKRTANPANVDSGEKEKQKARFTYGVLERQFSKYFKMARDRPGITGDNLLGLLETRFDNVVFRLSFADSRRQARQLVNHGHFRLNGRRMDIASHLVKQGDVITWKYVNGSVPEFVSAIAEELPKRPVPAWLQLDVANMTGNVVAMPERLTVDSDLNVRLVVEFYSK